MLLEEQFISELEIGAYVFRLTKRTVDGCDYYKSEAIREHHNYDINPELDRPVFMMEFVSRSNPALVHKVYKDRQGLYCTCTGFRTHGHCWHVDKVKIEEDNNNGKSM